MFGEAERTLPLRLLCAFDEVIPSQSERVRSALPSNMVGEPPCLCRIVSTQHALEDPLTEQRAKTLDGVIEVRDCQVEAKVTHADLTFA